MKWHLMCANRVIFSHGITKNSVSRHIYCMLNLFIRDAHFDCICQCISSLLHHTHTSLTAYYILSYSIYYLENCDSRNKLHFKAPSPEFYRMWLLSMCFFSPFRLKRFFIFNESIEWVEVKFLDSISLFVLVWMFLFDICYFHVKHVGEEGQRNRVWDRDWDRFLVCDCCVLVCLSLRLSYKQWKYHSKRFGSDTNPLNLTLHVIFFYLGHWI